MIIQIYDHMRRLIIPLFLLLAGTPLFSQMPESVNAIGKLNANIPDMCNDAGTFNLGPIIGQSNDGARPTIFLCRGDSIRLLHNLDYDLSGDPDPLTPAGIAYSIGLCPPTIDGPTAAAIDVDPCLVNDPLTNYFYVVRGDGSGNITLANSGQFNANPLFNGGNVNPVNTTIFFSPLTIDNAANGEWENSGSCVNHRIDQATEVVYLTEIEFKNTTIMPGAPCLARYRPDGGFQDYDGTSTYSIDVVSSTNPGAKINRYDNFNPVSPANNLLFSVEEPGIYVVTAEDGKSCAGTYTFDMTGCVPSTNITLSVPDIQAVQGTQVCIPLTVPVAQATTGISLSLEWDTNVLQFVSFNSGDNSAFDNLIPGRLGLLISPSPVASDLQLVSGDTLVTYCFNVIGDPGECSPLTISNVPTSLSATRVGGGTMGMTLIDGNFCVALPQPFDVVLTFEDTTCSGTVIINVAPNGGVEPYGISWQGPGALGGTATGLQTGGIFQVDATLNGTYTFVLTDATGTTSTVSRNISLDSYGSNLILTPPTCNGLSDGTVAVQILRNNTILNNPGALFSYQWTGGTIPNPTGSSQNPVPAGQYAVTLTHSTIGCTMTASGFLSEPSALVRDNIVVGQPSCTGVLDGSFIYTAGGGTPVNPQGQYSYTWNFSPTGTPPGDQFAVNILAQPFSATARAAGTYYLTLTDGNGCTFTDEFVLDPQKTLRLDSVLQTNVRCFGDKNGSLEMQVITTPPSAGSYTFSLSGPPVVGVFQTPVPPSGTWMQGLPAATFTIIANEAGTGCSVQRTFTISEPPPLVAAVLVQDNPTCTAINNGRIGVQASGGTGTNYQYAWSPTPPAPAGSVATANNLTEDDYRVIVSDVVGCMDTLDISLRLPLPPSLVLDSTSVRCGNDGCVSVTATTPRPGSSISTYLWTDLGTSAVIGSSDEVCNLSGGIYSVLVTDSDGCSTLDTLALLRPEILQITGTPTQIPTCFGNANGSVGVQLTGGVAPYSFDWGVPGGTFSVLGPVAAGLYTVTVSDAVGCTVEQSIVLENPPQILLSFVNVQPTRCFNTTDGSATPVVVLGTNPATSVDVSFAWENGSTDSIPTNLASGINRLTVSYNNCFVIDSVLITSPGEVLGIPSFAKPVTCFGGNDGAAFGVGVGGAGGPFTFEWSTGATTADITDITAGNYTATISDAAGCTGTHLLSVPEPAQLILRDSTINILCSNDQNGSVLVTPVGGNGAPFTYMWDGGIGNTNRLDDLGPGTYYVTATDSKGCTAETFIVLDSPPPVLGSYDPWEDLVCFGDQTTLTIDSIYGGSGGPYQFTVDYGVELPVDFPISIGGGWHVIGYVDRIGCTTEDSIFVVEPEQVTVAFPQNVVEVELGDTTFQLIPTITPADIASFTWTNGEFLSDPLILRPFAYNNNTTTYTLVVTNSAGCTGEGSIRVEIDPNRNVYIPNIFNPGSTTGLNDRFTPYIGFGVTEVESMQIYDRWGSLLYFKENFVPNNNDYSEGWDGNYKGKKMDPGVYVYVVNVLFRDGRKLTYRGDVTLIR